MHPDIKAFWENINLIHRIGATSLYYYSWYLQINNDICGSIIARECKNRYRETIYYFNNTVYTEEQMLKLINLKVFI